MKSFFQSSESRINHFIEYILFSINNLDFPFLWIQLNKSFRLEQTFLNFQRFQLIMLK